MMISVNSQKHFSKSYLAYIGNNICTLHNALINIKNRYILNKENKINLNFSFTLPYKNNIENKAYNYNTINNLFSTEHNLSNISTNFTDNQTLGDKNDEETLLKDNNQLQYKEPNNTTITLEEEITYEAAYNLLLNLLQDDIELLEEVLSIAHILVKEGVVVAPDSKIKKNIAKIMPYIQKQKEQNLGNSR